MNSVFSVFEGGQPVLIPNSEGVRTTSSALAFTDTGGRLVGLIARRQNVLEPKVTIDSAAHISWRSNEVRQEVDRSATTWFPDTSTRCSASSTRSRRYRRALREFAEDAERHLGACRPPTCSTALPPHSTRWTGSSPPPSPHPAQTRKGRVA